MKMNLQLVDYGHETIKCGFAAAQRESLRLSAHRFPHCASASCVLKKLPHVANYR